MGNHSIPVVDKDHITDEERTRLLNRAALRRYRSRHRENYRKYQVEYQKKAYHTPAMLLNRKLVNLRKVQKRVIILEQEIDELRKQITQDVLNDSTKQD